MNRLFWILLALALGCSNPVEPRPTRVICVDYADTTSNTLTPGPCTEVPQ